MLPIVFETEITLQVLVNIKHNCIGKHINKYPSYSTAIIKIAIIEPIKPPGEENFHQSNSTVSLHPPWN